MVESADADHVSDSSLVNQFQVTPHQQVNVADGRYSRVTTQHINFIACSISTFQLADRFRYFSLFDQFQRGNRVVFWPQHVDSLTLPQAAAVDSGQSNERVFFFGFIFRYIDLLRRQSYAVQKL